MPQHVQQEVFLVLSYSRARPSFLSYSRALGSERPFPPLLSYSRALGSECPFPPLLDAYGMPRSKPSLSFASLRGFQAPGVAAAPGVAEEVSGSAGGVPTWEVGRGDRGVSEGRVEDDDPFG